MKWLIIVLMLCSSISYASTKGEYLDTARYFAAQAYGASPKNIIIAVKDTTKVPWLSWKRRGAIWLSPAIVTWDDDVKPVWEMGVGTSYALGRHSSILMQVYRENKSHNIRPRFGWAIHF
jgi:hypothetical protein